MMWGLVSNRVPSICMFLVSIFNSLHVQIRHGLMLLWFTDLMNVTEEVTIRLKISKLSLDFSFAGRRLRYI